MKSLVAIAYVPELQARVNLAADGKSIDASEASWTISSHDEFALEEAVRLKESRGGSVTVISVGPERVKAGLRECLARGADEAVWVSTAWDSDLDALGVARNIAAIYQETAFDILWFGQRSVSWEESLVGPMTAELLGLPHIAAVVKFDITDGDIVCEREIEGGREQVGTSTPCILLAQKGLNEPRYPSLKGIMAARKRPIREKPATLFAPVTNLRRLELPPPPLPCRFITGGNAKSSTNGAVVDLEAAAWELARILHEEAGVI